MIKRITFGGDPPTVPSGISPVRVTLSTPLPDFGDCGYDRIVTEWFDGGSERFPAPGGSTVVAEESVLRGADWLEQRWRSGGEWYKHMALASRADGLTRSEFSRRWRAHAGTSGGVRIPDSARGLAYAQNHVVSGEFDAVNEVWFDDLGALRMRVAWFTENPVKPDGLFGESRFLCVREILCS